MSSRKFLAVIFALSLALAVGAACGGDDDDKGGDGGSGGSGGSSGSGGSAGGGGSGGGGDNCSKACGDEGANCAYAAVDCATACSNMETLCAGGCQSACYSGSGPNCVMTCQASGMALEATNNNYGCFQENTTCAGRDSCYSALCGG